MTQVKTTFRQVKSELFHKTLGLLINQKLDVQSNRKYSWLRLFRHGRFKGHLVTYEKVL